MAGTLTVDTIQSDSSYASTLNVASKMNFAAGMQIGGQDTTFGGMRNRIINGDMRIDQRNAGASVTPASNPTYTLDRWVYTYSQNSKFSVQQNAGSVTPPVGFTNYIGFTSLAATSLGATDYFILRQKIEGYNTADLNFGSASAKTVTLSFQVYSSLTGTFGGAITNSAENRCYPFSYTISSANTWEQKSITIAGDTTGTWLTTNGTGIELSIGLGVGTTYSGTAGAWTGSTNVSVTGAVNVAGTNGATFYITGVQLEKGSAATAFEQLHQTHILALCQRYYYKQSGASQYIRIGTGFVGAGSTTTLYAMVNFPVTMRAKPTSVDWVASLGVWNGGGIASVSNVTLESGSESTTTAVAIATSTGLTAQQPYQLIGNASSTAALAFNAEL